MERDKTIEMINLYFDNRLTKAEEVILFSHLAENEEARNLFKEHFILKEIMNKEAKEFPTELDNDILDKVFEKENASSDNNHSSHKFSSTAIVYTAAAILLAISFLFISLSNSYRQQIEMTSQKLDEQSKMIELLMNSMPSATVRTQLQNEIIIEPTS